MTGGNWQDTSASIGTSTAEWGMGNGSEVVVEIRWNPHHSPRVTDGLYLDLVIIGLPAQRSGW